MAVGDRSNLFLVEGLRPRNRFDHRVFMDGTYWPTSMDLVRNAATELLARDIHERNISGAVAEVGVYQGNFAALLNYHFRDRTLYLFDTFEGFDGHDTSIDRDRGWSDFPHDFSGTSVEAVLNKLPHPDKTVVRKGWFPASATEDEGEKFCLVSIDVDLYQPTLAALRWFYPRLSEGGHMLVHDYNNDEYKGVKHALREFGAETRIAWSLWPDRCGTAVVTKGY